MSEPATARTARRRSLFGGRTSSDSRQVLACLAMLLLPMASREQQQQQQEPPQPSGHQEQQPQQQDQQQACGGHLTARRGTIATPNFPGPFAVPLSCRWLLDASELADQANASIVVYLSQLYAFRGLSFTEYAYYESETVSFGGALVQAIDEGNVFEHRWLRTFRPYLLVEFQLDRLEGNHVRVLDNLLDVYGFNLTYEMTEDRENPNSCSLRDCSYAGNCLLASDYASFYCDCFEGFGGRHCGHGPLCVTERGNPICQNGGTCRHVGAAAVRCLCAPRFSGDFCEISQDDSEENGCNAEANCIFQCPYPGERQQQQQQQQQRSRPCQCKKPVRVHTDRTRFECRIKLTNVTYPRGVDFTGQNVSLESHLSKQLSKYIWDSNISSMEELKILSVTPALEVNFHFFGNTLDADKIRAALNRLVQRRRLAEFFLEPSHFTFQQKPALRLQSLRINQVNERQVQLGDQFILSCLAVGSTDLKFSWYKDDMAVNMSKATREIWYRHMPNDGSDYHTSILTVDKATLLDEGRYTCQVVDWGVQQCRSIHIDVKDEPNVKVVPMSSTLEKGSTLRLMCTTPNMRSIGIGFGWTKNRALLKLEPGQEVWEDLYPAGSLLTISHAQKSATYTCNVAHHSSSVRVEVVNRTQIPLCLGDRHLGLGWPETAPGSKALLACPQGFVGRHASRQCNMRDAVSSGWELPDFSGCLYEPLVQPYNDFRSLTLGYESTNGSSTIQAFWDVLQNRRSSFYPGEGDRIIGLLQEVEHYLYNVDELEDLKNSVEATMRIIDRILSNEDSILSQAKLLSLSQLVIRNLGYWSQDSSESHKHLSLAELVVDVLPMKVYSSSSIMYSLKIPQDNQNKYPDWYNERVTIRLYQNRLQNANKTVSGIVVVYRDLAQFFPDTYITELDDGSDMEYRLSSRVISVSTSYRGSERDERFSIELEFAGARNHSKAWNASCGVLGPDGDWNLDSCSLAEEGLLKDSVLHCLCSNPGTFAAFLTTRAEKVVLAKNDQTNFVVILGCSSCLLQCLVSMLVLTAFWWRNRTWLNFLKIQCCVAVIAAMATFIYAVHIEIAEDSLSVVAMCLEAFLLIGTSSPISQALIIYAELSNIHPSQQLQPTVVAVITGVPILALLTTELTRKTIGWKHESWWLVFDTGVYNIFVICSITLLLTFLLLYIAVIHKTRPLLYKFTKKDVIQQRVRMLHRSAIVIFGIVAMEVSSVFYVNSSSIIYHYVFAFQSALLGFIILAMYVMSGEVLVVAPVLHKLKRQAESDDECASEPTKGRSKEREFEKELSSCSSGPGLAACNTSTTLPSGTTLLLCEPVAVYPEARGVAVGIDAREYVNEAAAGAYAAAVSAGIVGPEIQIHHVDDIHLENYSRLSPRRRLQQRRYEPAEKSSFVLPRNFAANSQTTTTTTTAAAATTTSQQHCTQPYKELVTLSNLPTTPDLHHLQQQQQQHLLQAHQRLPPQQTSDCPTSLLCSAQIETCLTMPDVTLAINGDAEHPHPILVVAPLVEAQQKISCGTTVTSQSTTMPDIANTMEQRKQPDGEDVLLKVGRQHEIVVEQLPDQTLNTNGMLDRISHDLDYLLNRTKEDA
ncbi:uncharacterized protein LOC100123035 isoform X2 [Nasonia vitripennis]|uniref:Uncharacterized protein n=1 Tax=Nasonia vitripennis TaxID=7425 RepID=A0A7M7QHJ9_NASVI|nr:uncharacterized protein LOC100123035 isoform X2 [Nasonia vitripennis]